MEFRDYQRESPVPGVQHLHLYDQPGDDGSRDPKTRPLIATILGCQSEHEDKTILLKTPLTSVTESQSIKMLIIGILLTDNQFL